MSCVGGGLFGTVDSRREKKAALATFVGVAQSYITIHVMMLADGGYLR